MRQRQLVIFVLLLLFWLVLSEASDIQHVITGIVLAGFLTWFWGDLFHLLPGQSQVKDLPGLISYGLVVVWEIILANIAVARTILPSGPQLDGDFICFRPDLKTPWGRVLLANSITITPGTLTVDVNPDTGVFMVHGLTKEMREGLANGRLVRQIQKLESKGAIK